MIEQIERLRAELQVHTLCQLRVLHQRHIHVLKSRTIQNIPSRIAKRSRRRERERRCVEPLKRRRIRKVRIADDIRAIVRAEAENGTAGAAVVDLRKQSDGERTSRLKRDDSVSFPSA